MLVNKQVDIHVQKVMKSKREQTSNQNQTRYSQVDIHVQKVMKSKREQTSNQNQTRYSQVIHT